MDNFLRKEQKYSKDCFKYIFDYSFRYKLPDSILPLDMNLTSNKIFLSDPSTFSEDILFPEDILKSFFNSENINNNINDIFSYKSKFGDERVLDSIRRYQYARYGQLVSIKNILQTIGATNAIDLAISAIINENFSLLLPTPSYFTFRDSVISRGQKCYVLYCKEEMNFVPNLKIIKYNIKSSTKAVGIIQPSFPTGFRIPTKELIRIIDFLSTKNIYIILDLLYDLLAYKNSLVLCEDKELGECFQRNINYVIQINGLSKIWSAPGLRFGYMIASEEIIQKAATEFVARISRCPVFLAPLYSELMDCTSDIITDPTSKYRRMLIKNTCTYKSRVQKVLKLISKSGLEIVLSDSGFNTLIKLPKVQNTYEKQWDFALSLYNNTGIFMDFGFTFGIPHHQNIPTYARLNLGLTKEKLENGIKSLAYFYHHY